MSDTQDDWGIKEGSKGSDTGMGKCMNSVLFGLGVMLDFEMLIVGEGDRQLCPAVDHTGRCGWRH